MTGKDRTLTALGIQKPDRVPLYIHGINEVPIIGSSHPGCSSPRSESDLLKPLRDCATSLWKRPWSAIHRFTIGQVQP